MEPSVTVGLCWLLFGVTHIGLATRRVRAMLVGRLGELGFDAFFMLIAALAFSLVVHEYAIHRAQGAAGFGLAGLPALRTAGILAIGAGVVLMAGGLARYRGSPMALATHPVSPPCGMARVSRHSFFAGLILFGVAHAVLAARMVGAVFFTCGAAVALVGALHQDAKLRARFGRPYADYLAATSFVPFAAALSGRQRIVWRELPWLAFGVGIAVTFALRAGHESIFVNGGAWVIGATLAAVVVLTLPLWLEAGRARRTTG